VRGRVDFADLEKEVGETFADSSRRWVRAKERVDTGEQEVERDPPASAEFLLELFLRSKRGKALIGDMRERFGRDCEELGRKRAVRRYWADTVGTVGPMLRRAIAKAIKWGAFVDAFWHHWRG
jgi:hypothetical protein